MPYALIRNLADAIKTEAPHDVARPAGAVGRGCQRLLCLQHRARLCGLRVAAEVALAAEQPEPIDDRPGDGDAGRRLDGDTGCKRSGLDRRGGLRVDRGRRNRLRPTWSSRTDGERKTRRCNGVAKPNRHPKYRQG